MKTPRKWMITKIGFAISSIFLPVVAFANIQITEVMYDAPGADSGREWIEVTNTGSEVIDIGKYKLFENGTNHGLTSVAGGTILSQGASAIVAADANKFKADYPSFSGMLFDSAFLLSNTGESLTIKNASSTELSSATYTTTPDADGTGGSLQLKDGAFVAAMASPGVYPGAFIPVVKKAASVGKVSKKKTTTTSPSKTTKSSSSKKTQAASPAETSFTDTPTMSWFSTIPTLWFWIAGLVAIILVGAGGVFFILGKEKETSSLADEFNIE